MSEPLQLWIVEDEPALRTVLGELFDRPEYEVSLFAGAAPALARAAKERAPRLVLSDLALSGGPGGLELFAGLKTHGGELEFILMTAYASAESALKALRLGAFDYVIKPFSNDELTHLVANAAAKLRLTTENRRLRRALDEGAPGVELIGQAPEFQKVLALIESLGSATASVLITGESGTGKELIARALHRRAGSEGAPFITVNCGAMPEPLLESELFGYQKGAFTGASENRRGLIESAQGGTLFLDEIGDMPLPMQVKLLRVLQERKVRPLGASQERPVEFRLICATHRDLAEMVRERQFREDLFYRIKVISLDTPPLRARAADIPLLAHHFLRKFTRAAGGPQGFTPAAIGTLSRHPWPGNVRELENVIERAVVLCRTPQVDAVDLGLDAAASASGDLAAALRELPAQGLDLEALLDGVRTNYLRQALARCGGSQTEAAALLRITYRSLRYYMKKLPPEESGS